MLNKIIYFSIKNKLLIGIATILLVIWGVWSAVNLPVDAVPDITNNQVQIYTTCPTLAGQEVEQLVTFPVEQSLANVPGIEEIRSVSRFGLSVVTAVFREDVDIYFARQLVNEKLKEAGENIPPGIGTPEMAPISTGLGEVYQYIIHPKKGSEVKYSAMDLRSMQDWIVARQLYGTPGVAEVNGFGGELKQYEVAVNPDRLKAMDVTIPEIFDALERNNENTGGAYIDKKPNAYFIRGVGLITSLEEVKNIPVKTFGLVPVYIRDVAEVRLGSAVRYGALTYNGELDAVGGIVMMLKGANSNDVVNRIKQKLPEIQSALPDDVVIEPYLDRTDLVGRAIKTVEKNLIEGALIVIFVLVLFLGNFRAGLIVASTIPLSLLFALGMMKLFGVSANLMSLGAIDFGLIVDGAVIVVEATLHHLGLRKASRKLTQSEMDEEVYQSASGIRSAAAFGEVIILIVYIPILTLVGVEGKMFTPMAKTVGFAILGALILSLTYIPMMSALFLSKHPVKGQTFSDRLVKKLQNIYAPLLQKAIRVRYILVSLTVALFLFVVFLFSRMGGEFIPQLQEGDFAFHCILPQGTSLKQSIETSMLASSIIKEFEEVEMVIGKTGTAEVPTDPMPPEATDLMIILKPQKAWTSGRSYEQLGEDIMHKLEVIPGVFFEKNQPIQMRFNELMTGIRQDVAVKIFGENLDSLVFYAMKVSDVIGDISGVTAPQVERVSGLPQITVTYNRTRLTNYGLTVRDVNNVLSTAFAGKSAGLVYENERRFDLVVRLDSAHNRNIEDVKNLLIPAGTGVQIPLNQLADIEYKIGPAQISREAGKRRIVIGFNVSGRDVQSVVEDIQQQLDQKVKLPVGYYLTYGGQFENLQKASDRLLIAVPVSLLLIFFLLYLTFHSFKQALLIFTAIPMSAIGGVFALMLRDMPFSISAGIGFIALFGVAVLNGIVLIGKFNELKQNGVDDVLERVRIGTMIRLRPVLMTAMVASLGFIPMAISTSAGVEVQRPLATVVIGGLLTATFLTLFILPLLYIIFNRKKEINRMSGTTVKTLGLCIGLLFTGMTTHAQQVISMEEAVSLALKNNSFIQAKSMEISAAKSLNGTVGLLPKTQLNIQYGNNEGFEYNDGLQISQTIPFPSAFKARKGLVQKQVLEKEWSLKVSENELRQLVRLAYVELEFLKQNAGVLLYLDSLHEAFLQIASVRFKAGDIRYADIGTAEVNSGQIKLLVKQNNQQLEAAYNKLSTLMQKSDSFDITIQKDYQPLSLNLAIDTANIREHPSVQQLEAQAALFAQNGKLEKSEGLPDFTFGYNNVSLIGMHEKNGVEQYYGRGQRFSYVDFGVSIPLTYGATRARVKSYAYQQSAAEKNALWQKQLLETELKNAVQLYELSNLKYLFYKNQSLPNAASLIRAAETGYKTGDISYVEYVFTLQTVTGIHLNYLKSIREVNEAIINIYSIINL